MRSLKLASGTASRAGISMIEVMLTIVVIGTISTIGVLAVSNVHRNTQHRKLEADVKTLNSAISLYLSNGGNLDGLSDPSAVLAKLKTSRNKEDRRLHVGAPSGKMIDPRVAAIPVPAESWKWRASYDTDAKRFLALTSGEGVEFTLDEQLGETLVELEDRSSGPVSYAATSTWVWDHAATVNPNAPKGPSNFTTNPYVSDSTPVDPEPPTTPPSDPGSGGVSPEPPSPPEPPKPPKLPTPVFSMTEGAHPEDDFPLSVSITNLPGSMADPIYQLDGGAWQPYSGAVSVAMNQTLRAQFLTKDAAAFSNSSQKSSYYYPVPDSLSGTVDGNFHSPGGGSNLVYQITNANDRFTHGDPVFMLDGEPVNSGDPNVVEFAAQSFSNVAPGAKFILGRVAYHNGNSYHDSHATSVALQIVISLPDRGETIAFDLNFDLVNTENDPDDPQASADYVKITNLQQNIPLSINGVGYKIKLEFGATDSFGFSSQSQFHVYEGATGRGELLGTFLPN